MTNLEKPLRFIGSKPAAVLSVALCLPLLFAVITATLGYEPAFVRLLTSSDGYTPTTLGRIVMLGMLLGLPVAFVINLLPMFTKADSEQPNAFRVTPAHALIGMSILVVLLVMMRQGALYELRPFVTPLGLAAILGQILFLLLQLVLPVAFLFNRLPWLAKAGSGGSLAFRPTSINLIIGAAILLLIIMAASSFALEATACAIGVPNCD